MEFDEEFMMDFSGVIILKYSNSSTYSIIFQSGISVTVEEVEGILQMMLLVPSVFKGWFPYYRYQCLLSFNRSRFN